MVGALEAFARRDVPFEQLVEALEVPRDASRNPLFQVMLAVEETPADEGLPVVFERLDHGVSRLDLTLFMERRSADLALVLEYNSDLFDASTAQRLLASLAQLLRGAVDEPERPLTALSLLRPSEERQMLVEWNELAPAATSTLHGLFAAAAAATPERVAVVWNDEQLSYGALHSRVAAGAQVLRRLGVERGGRVGIALERSPGMVVAILAVLEAGGAYVPLDPAYPAERLAFMVQDSGAAVVIGEGDGSGVAGGEVRWVSAAELFGRSAEDESRRRRPLGTIWPMSFTPRVPRGDRRG